MYSMYHSIIMYTLTIIMTSTRTLTLSEVTDWATQIYLYL